jgi:hypothetical protein
MCEGYLIKALVTRNTTSYIFMDNGIFEHHPLNGYGMDGPQFKPVHAVRGDECCQTDPSDSSDLLESHMRSDIEKTTFRSVMSTFYE